MSPSKQIAISKSEEHALDDLAHQSDFWSRIRAAYAAYDALTERQYELLREHIARNSWKRNAARVAGHPVRNKYCAGDGTPRCAHRGTPWCKATSTRVVGAFGYCAEHADEARAEFDAWKASHTAQFAEPSGSSGDVINDLATTPLDLCKTMKELQS